MKRQVATFLFGLLCLNTLVHSYTIELNTSYDYYRGLPDGSWNGNNGAFLSANGSICLFDCLNGQAGVSYGFYNWDGRGNLVFRNSKTVQRQGFFTTGFSASFCQFNAGLVYDRMFTNHFGIYDLNPSIDQLRFQTGYQCCCEEFGLWGTLDLNRSHQRARGVPIIFKAIGQMNLFWTHFFNNCAKTSVWIGIPYRHSLMHSHERSGNFILGFSFRTPLTECLFIDGHAAYMRARSSHGSTQSRNYDANICFGITYLFTDECLSCHPTYMPLANNSNFMVDTNVNQ